jgi:phage tail sheath gpL-like
VPISYNQIPSDLLVPLVAVELDNSAAVTASVAQPYKALVIGQRLAAGKVLALTPTKVQSAAQAADAFGAGSMLHNMAEAYFKQNTYTDTWFVAVDDAGSSVAASGTIVFSGAPTAAGTLSVYIAGRLISVAVSTTSTAATIATALAAAINAATNLPVTAAATTATVTLTAKNKGAVGNGIDVRLNYVSGETTPAGLTATITAMSGGTGVVDLTPVWASSVTNDQYDVIATAYTDAAALTSLETELARRAGPLVHQQGMAFAAVTGNQSAALGVVTTRNSPYLSVMAANQSPSPAWEWAAETAAIVAFNAPNDPARPFKTLPYAFVKAAARGVLFSLTERQQLLQAGAGTHTVGADGTVRVEYPVTTYKTNAAGVPDTSYQSVNTLLTLSYLRSTLRTRLASKYGRHKLVDDGTRIAPGQAAVSPNVLKAEVISLAREWEATGVVENVDAFIAGLIVERNTGNRNRVDIKLSPDLVNQLLNVAAQIQFVL